MTITLPSLSSATQSTIRSVGALEFCCAIGLAKASEQMANAISEILEFLGIVFLASNSVPFDSDATHSWNCQARWPVFESNWLLESRLGRRFAIAWIAAWLAFCGLAVLFVFLRN